MPQYSGIWTEQAVMQAVGAGNWPGNPGAPTIGTATAGDASASVTFTAPTDNGGSAITGYTVTSSPGGLTGTGSASPITVSGLTNGTAYTFTVTATNATGTGPASAASNSVTPVPPNYIEDVYSTYLYTGNDTGQSINNGIDVSGKGGLVWIKKRSASQSHNLLDTVRGNDYNLNTNNTNAQGSGWSPYFNFASTGFTLTTDAGFNTSGSTYTSWTFREQEKFFDIVTYTGNGSARTISHNLGSAPGCIIIKCLNDTFDWIVWHRSFAANNYNAFLNTADAAGAYGVSSSTAPTSSVFSLTTSPYTNSNGKTYVAYLFAHDAGGFGLTGTDNVVSCGAITADSGGSATINLGYEPQWFLLKSTNYADNWYIADNMRGWSLSGWNWLIPNSSGAEAAYTNFNPTATGAQVTGVLQPNASYIYVAIRRGPMKVPTVGTTVFSPVSRTGTGTSTAVTTPGFPPDMLLQARTSAPDWPTSDRLRGVGQNIAPCYTSAENTPSPAYVESYDMTGATLGSGAAVNGSGLPYIEYFFQRAPSFFDVVCYTGNGSTQNINHNLGVVPEMIWVKQRSAVRYWPVYSAATGNSAILQLDTTGAVTTGASQWNSTTPTSSVFSLGSTTGANVSGGTYVAYLFATAPGVSKVGSYVGDDTIGRVINCGFTTGARFILLKKTSTTSDWYVYDTARGIVSGNEKSMSLNSTAAESGSADVIDPDASGFAVGTAASNFFNETGVSYIFFAIA